MKHKMMIGIALSTMLLAISAVAQTPQVSEVRGVKPSQRTE
jgi:hypothetical protein